MNNKSKEKLKCKREGEKMSMNMKKIEKNESKGITLIALVVTIVVLLILAGISISIVLGEGGIIDAARKAGELTNAAIANEQQMLQNIVDWADEYLDGTGGNTEGKETIVDKFNAGELKIGDYVNYLAPSEGSYTVAADRSGVERWTEAEKAKAEEGMDIKVGDQTFSVATNSNIKWRILGKDEKTGGLKLIAAKPIKSDRVKGTAQDPYFYMYGAESYEYGPTELNKICKIFKNDLAEEARSINMDDINEALGIKTEDKIKEYNADPIMDDDAKQYGDTYSYSEAYTPESWLQEQEEIKTNPEKKGTRAGTISDKVDGYAYIVDVPEEAKLQMEGMRNKNTRGK